MTVAVKEEDPRKFFFNFIISMHLYEEDGDPGFVSVV